MLLLGFAPTVLLSREGSREPQRLQERRFAWNTGPLPVSFPSVLAPVSAELADLGLLQFGVP